jgi:serine/threonine-protein kinase
MADSERIGPYRVIQKLGAGGMGEVVLAHDDRLDRLVAIKRLHTDHAATPERRERFRREARIAARINHPAIVQIHDVLHQGDHDFLIMEYVEGRNLRERCTIGPMAVSEVLGIAHQIALGMAAAHDLGVIHRDLKAENILVTPAGRAKITDFGIAKLHGEDSITADGAVVGTFRAMSPEQALGRAIDHRSDLFSFGILLYEALAGVSPFRAETPFLTVQRLVIDPPQPITELVPTIPSALASLVHQLLTKEPLLRPRDFHEVADALIELAGEVCDAPCHAGVPPGGGRPAPGKDTELTHDDAAPAGPRAALAGKPTSGLDNTVDTDAETASQAPALAASLTPAPAASQTPAPAAAAAPVAATPTGSRNAVRRRRWYAAAAGLVIVSALGIGYAVRGRDRAVPSSPAPLLRVAVLEPDLSGADGRPDVALLATAVRNAVMAGVRARVGLDLVPRTDVDSYVDGYRQTSSGRRPGQRKIRDAVGADEVIATHIQCVPSSCQVTLERDTSSASNPPSVSFQLAADTARRPDDTVAVHLGRLYPDHLVRAGAATRSLDPRDHERYVRLVQDYWAGKGAGSTAKVLAELESVRQRSPGVLDVLLFEAEIRGHWYLETLDPDQLRRALALLQDADALSPDTYGILSARFDLALVAGKLDDASALLERLAVIDPDSSATHLARAKLHYHRGELELARDELAAAARRDSFSWRVQYHQARVSTELRDPAAAGAALDELLRRSPGNYAGLSLLARGERTAGRLACAEQIYARLVAREPLYDESVRLGLTLNQLGRYAEAADSFRRAQDLRPADPATLLNLAESLLFAGDTSGAEAQLRVLHELLARKRRDSPTGALTGADLSAEVQTLAYLGRRDPALATAARARVAELLTPDAGPGALYIAAAVHAALGDRSQAATYATKYLDRGGSPAEFRYPSFDDLRRDPALSPRLTISPVTRSCELPAP